LNQHKPQTQHSWVADKFDIHSTPQKQRPSFATGASMSLTKNSCSTITTATAKDSIHRTPVKQEDELTACETPLSSPEFQSPIVTRKMKKEKDQQVTESKNQQEQPSLKDEDRQTSLGEAEAEVAKVSVDEDEDYTQDYSNWPMEGIKDPSKNDVLYGRGGG